MNLKDVTHQLNRVFFLIITDKGVLHSGLLAKYLAAFFRMSRSSVIRRSSDLSRAFSEVKSRSSEGLGCGSPYFLIQAYKLWVVVSSR